MRVSGGLVGRKARTAVAQLAAVGAASPFPPALPGRRTEKEDWSDLGGEKKTEGVDLGRVSVRLRVVAAQEEEEAAVAAAEEEILSEEEALDAPDPRAAVNESDPAVLRVIAERRKRREAARQKYKEELLAMVNEVKQAAAAPGGLKEEETVADVSNVPLQYGATEISQLGEVVGKGGGGEKGGRADAKGVTGGASEDVHGPSTKKRRLRQVR
ncbi:unnamed protein product [Closterium sp. Naga37s-1]|nr:unnamed protein product [Closterium sp. Naga37s-1]